MSSDEHDRPRKTLTLKKTVRQAPIADDAPKRKRSGARARFVAQLERAKEKDLPIEQRGAPPQAPRRDRGASDYRGRREAGASAQRSPHAGLRSSAAERESSRRRPNDETRTPPSSRPQTFYDPFEDDAPAPQASARPLYNGRQAEIFSIFAPCPQDLEEALAAELQALKFDDTQEGRAGCTFSTDWAGVQRANLYSRLATRILVQVAHAEISHEDDILDLARDTPWERWFGAEHTLRVDTSAIKSPVQSLQYCNLRAKDGICDRLRELEGARPSIDTVRPDARVHLFLTGHTATLYLDTSGESLFKRGWRLDKGEAPLRENLAAGMLALAGWDPAVALLDPFCGSGTILIEAAWIALGVPPGISRPFGFERLRDHDKYRWHDLKDDARSQILPKLDAPLVGYDLDPQAIEFARNNAERAWLSPDTVRFEQGDARHIEAPAPQGWIVTNPPYGERMSTDQSDQADLWRDWASCLKRNFAGWQLHIISSDMSLPQQLRFKPMRRYPLHNGALDCRLFSFELVAKGYRDVF